jgi:hypothetical protein
MRVGVMAPPDLVRGFAERLLRLGIPEIEAMARAARVSVRG